MIIPIFIFEHTSQFYDNILQLYKLFTFLILRLHLHIPKPKWRWQFVHQLRCIVYTQPEHDRLQRVCILVHVEYGPQVPKLLLTVCVDAPLGVVHALREPLEHDSDEQVEDHHAHGQDEGEEDQVGDGVAAEARHAVAFEEADRHFRVGVEAHLADAREVAHLRQHLAVVRARVRLTLHHQRPVFA